MGSVEESTPAKPSKQNASTQESSIMPSYLDWQTALQTYHGARATPPPFFTSTVASSATPHPYLWGSQHFIPPYRTPFSYTAPYPHAGVYAHPNVAMVHCAAPSTIEMGREAHDGKDRASLKNSQGSSENALVCSKLIESEKVASGSGNDGFSQSPESGSEDSSDASDENTNQQEFSATKKRSFDRMHTNGANTQNNAADESSFGASGKPPASNLPVSVPGLPVVTMSATSLNVGMNLWNSSFAGAVPMKARQSASGVLPTMAPATVDGLEVAMPENQWIQDEHELKKQRRKLSNRESARRSRLRKQAECEELQANVETLSDRNGTLRKELKRLAEECLKLSSENKLIMEELTHKHGPDVISDLEVVGLDAISTPKVLDSNTQVLQSVKHWKQQP